MPKNTCETFPLSRVRTILEPLMIIVSFAVFLPQYIAFKYFGTLGTSPGWMLSFTLFSTTQLAGQFLNPAMLETVMCIQKGELRGTPAFSSLLGNLQVFAQWILSLILLSTYLIFRTETTNGEIQPMLTTALPASGPDLQQPSHFLLRHLAASNIPSFRLVQISSTYAVLLLTPTLLLLVVPEENNLGSKIVRLFIYLFFQHVTLVFDIALVVTVSIQQVRDIATARAGQGLSTWFLGLQGLNLAGVGLLQFFRPGNPVSDQWRHRNVGWFIERGSVPVLYFVLALVFAVTLGVRASRFFHYPVDNLEFPVESLTA